MSKRRAILRPLALAFILAVGFALAYGMFVGWLDSVWERIYGRRDSYVMESTEVRDDGQPIIDRTVVDRGRRQHDSYMTLDRVEVPPSTYRATGAALFVPRERGFGEFPLDPSSRVRAFLLQRPLGEFWYFIHDGQRAGRGYFVGFNTDSKLRLGFIGRRGYCPERPAREDCFAVDGLGLVSRSESPCELFPAAWSPGGYGYVTPGDFPPEKIFMIAGDQLLRVDLRERTVATVIDSAELVSLGMVEPVRPAKAPREPADGGTHHVLMAVRTADRVLLFDAAGKQKGAYTIPADLRGRSFTFYELADATALLDTEQNEFVWIDAGGGVLTRKKVTLENNRHGDQPWSVAGVVPAPIFMALAIAIGVAVHVFQGESPNYAAALRGVLSMGWPALLALSILGAVLAWLCCRRQRRYAQPWTAVWVAFVFLGGLPGLVGYLCHRRWPVLEACPACGRSVPRDREACAACGVAFPPPPQKGIEVFA